MDKAYKLGWIVALIEGEGWIGHRNGRPEIRVASVDEDVILKLHEYTNFIGRVSERSQPTVTGKRVWLWILAPRDKAGEFLVNLLPYLCERRQAKAIEVIAAWKALKPKRGTEPHCKNGHALDGYNLVADNGRRRCRECLNQKMREYRARLRDK